ncbi:unnamed protein product [Rotaria sordida]|uniref:F-box domain-containing protein n=1 Tax=Rotaria sordida TaxID=392033 RepID=A0A813VG91_9BILA|nr:unnamed protein product [Rotaria sordida]CAF0882440.1 unnamed protein product [Rotaria sordida]CAF3794642.1 unnamed protein product [Rotaria sordida]CAF3990808.1 unnamed protein product [Rotaria sordida]
MTSSIETLPPELFRFILAYLSPEDTSALAQTCHRMNIITRDDKIWQQYFLQRYIFSTNSIQYSDEEYLPSSALKFTEPPDNCTWQEYFIQRSLQDKHIRSLLNEIISIRIKRIHNAELISSTYGFLAFDVLRHYFSPSIDTSKQLNTSITLNLRNLTREYYSLDIARLISRNIGLSLLNDLKNRTETRTEGKALINALFIIQCFHPYGIFLSLNRLHLIGERLINDPIFSTLNVNEKCESIIKTMKIEKFLAANGGDEYYDLENSFLFSTFNGKPTIPLTLVAIFCALADECGLIARPIGFPGEVMIQVEQPLNNSIPLIISIFDGKIITLNEINVRLADVLDRPLTYPLFITPIIELVIRSARNIINSISRYTTSSLNSYGLYAAVSILKILGDGALPFAFHSMINVIKEHFPMDIRFLEMLSSPLTTLNDDLDQIRNQDLNPLPIEEKRRINSPPKFYAGQIFQHKQYNYWGVICGWDLICMASTLWQVRMGITNLLRGASQPFYHILANDSSRRYVAEDNINTDAFNLIDDQQEKYSIVQNLCSIDDIGKYFERVDVINARFIPNNELRNEYPDDFV